MADRAWYILVNGNREGPMPEAQLREQIAQGRVNADTLVWADPMKEWARAADVQLVSAGPPAAPGQAQPMPTAIVATGGQPGVPFKTTMRTFPLFGRGLLALIGQLLVIPTPWTTTMFYRWFVAELQPPNGKVLTFTGKPADIWYILMLGALCGIAGGIHYGVQLVLIPLSALFYLITMRWFFANIAWDTRREPLQFSGRYLHLLGWILLGYLSVITIVGWAWVVTAMMRWICRNVQGSSKQVSFVGSGWGVLWRSIVFGVLCIFIIPIPWLLRWYSAWYVSQTCLSNRV